MNKLLTIAIPTYNRAQILEKQLTWLAKAIKGFESECEIFISDNCSTDNTQEVIKKWQEIFSNTAFKFKKNSENIGVMRNFASCLQSATSKYVWVIADEDKIKDETVGYILNTIKQHSDLSLLLLNFSDYSSKDNLVIYDRIFPMQNQEYNADGKAVIEHYLATNHTGLGCMSATVYRTEVVQDSLKKWPESVNNLEGQTYWTVFCAMAGSINTSQEIYFEYDSPMYFQTKPKLWFRMRYADLPEIYAKLIEIGCNKKLCQKLILKHFDENNWKVIFGALRRWPVLTINAVIPYFGLVGVSAWESFLSPKHKENAV